MYLLMDLISKVFPGTPKDEFDDDPVIKFVPFSTPYEHSIPNAANGYVQLLQEQNQYLQDHVGIPVGGLSYEAMEYCPPNGMALDNTLHFTKFFTSLEPTSIVHKTGKWIFCTTKKKATSALHFIAVEMPKLYEKVPFDHRGDYPMCPNPRRLTRSPLRTAYMINIVNSANTNLTQHRNRNLQQAPKRNAWQTGPPTLCVDMDVSSSNASNISRGSTHLITQMDEHREEISLSITKINASLQSFQTKTDAQILGLTSKLQNQIQLIQLNTTRTQSAIQNSPSLSPENFLQLKDSIITDLTPVIQAAIEAAVPNIIRNHMDDAIGPAIFNALARLNLIALQPNQPNPAHHPTSGLSPPRKLSKHHTDDAMEGVISPSSPRKEPPDHPPSPAPDYS
jgi:hypothetical protein